MHTLNIRYFLLFAVLMFTAKPFLGFSLHNRLSRGNECSIFAKAFTKRKQEYVDGSEFDITTIKKRLTNPPIVLVTLFSFLLNKLFPAIFGSLKPNSKRILSAIHLNLLPPLPRYLLSGKLII